MLSLNDENYSFRTSVEIILDVRFSTTDSFMMFNFR